MLMGELHVNQANVDEQTGEAVHEEADDVNSFDCHVDIVYHVLLIDVVVAANAGKLIQPLQDSFDAEQPRKAQNEEHSIHLCVEDENHEGHDSQNIQEKISDHIVDRQVLLVYFPLDLACLLQVYALGDLLLQDFSLFSLDHVIIQVSDALSREKSEQYVAYLNQINEHFKTGRLKA